MVEFDEFRLLKQTMPCWCRRSGRKFRMGDRVWIVVVFNLTKRQLDFEWILYPERKINSISCR